MLPTLNDDDVLLVNKFSKHFSKRIEVGSMYIFVSPVDPSKLICKRVVAKVRIKHPIKRPTIKCLGK